MSYVNETSSLVKYAGSLRGSLSSTHWWWLRRCSDNVSLLISSGPADHDDNHNKNATKIDFISSPPLDKIL